MFAHSQWTYLINAIANKVVTLIWSRLRLCWGPCRPKKSYFQKINFSIKALLFIVEIFWLNEFPIDHLKYLCAAAAAAGAAAPGLSSNWTTKSTERAGGEDSPPNDRGLIGMRRRKVEPLHSTQLISLAGAHMAGCWPENDCGEEDEYISRRLRQEETEQQDWSPVGKTKAGAKSGLPPIIFSGLIRWEADLGPCGFCRSTK